MKQLGPYRIVRELASGGMAEVYLAEREGPEGFRKPVAIKRILPNLARDEEFVQMFLSEARLAAQFSHPNIVQIHELGDAEGEYYIAMEWVDGASLERVLAHAPARRLEPRIAAAVAAQVAGALQYAHTLHDAEGRPLNLIHRDVSPQNVMIGTNGAVKLVDFGIAKAAGRLHQTRGTTLKGKYAYMSPEQVEKNVALDHRSDLFALGAVLYECLSGTRPFSGDGEFQILMSVVNDNPPDLRLGDPVPPEALIAIVERALQKDRARRFPDAEAMHRDLERVSATLGEPVAPDEIAALVPRDDERAAPPVESVARRPKPSRSPLGLTLAAVLVATLVGVGIWAGTRGRGAEVETPPPTRAAIETPPAKTELALAPEPEPGPEVAAVEGPKSKRKGKRSVRHGTLRVEVSPPSEIRVDGRRIGRAPLSGVSLRPGKHQLEVVNRDVGLHFRDRIRVTAGETTAYVREFRKGALWVFVKPYGEVFVNGVRQGLTPLDGAIKLYEGEHSVRVVYEGREEVRTATVRPDRPTKLRFDFRK